MFKALFGGRKRTSDDNGGAQTLTGQELQGRGCVGDGNGIFAQAATSTGKPCLAIASHGVEGSSMQQRRSSHLRNTYPPYAR